VNPDDLIAALKSLPVEQLKAVLSGAGVQMSAPGTPDAPGGNPPPAAPAAPAMSDPNDPFGSYMADDSTPPYAKAIMSAFSKFSVDCSKRFGDAEAAINDIKPKAEMSAKMSAAYTAQREADRKDRVTRDVQKAIGEGRLEPRDRDDKIAAGLTKSDALTFSDGGSKGKTHYDAWRDELLSRKVTYFFSEVVEEGDPDPAKDPFIQKALGQMAGFREPAYRLPSQADPAK
jgi:hypothetical protein